MVEYTLNDFLLAYAKSFALRLGWVEGSWPCAKYMQKKIRDGKFISGGVANYNPVLLRLNGGYVLYWNDMLPILREPSVIMPQLEAFFSQIYQNMLMAQTHGPHDALVTIADPDVGDISLTMNMILLWFNSRGKTPF